MPERSNIAVIVLALAGLWILVYWLTPGPESATGDGLTITFGDVPIGTEELQAPAEPEVVLPIEREAAPAETLEEAMARVIPPEFGQYVVQFGDNAHAISRRLYGTTAHWQSILKANALTDPSKFRAGQTIRYPLDPKNVQGLPVDASGEPLDSMPLETEEDTRSTYIVARGDTLSGIAKAIYGRATLWRLIRDANRDKVNSEGTNIRPGMELVIPPPPARD